MPTYEKRADDGTVLERTVPLAAGHPSGYEEQMAALAADDGSPWHLVDDVPADNPPFITALVDDVISAAAARLATVTVEPPFAHNDLKTEEV